MKSRLLSTIIALAILITGLFPTIVYADMIPARIIYLDADTLEPIQGLFTSDIEKFVTEQPDGILQTFESHSYIDERGTFYVYMSALPLGKNTLTSYPVPDGYEIVEIIGYQWDYDKGENVETTNGFMVIDTSSYPDPEIYIHVRKSEPDNPAAIISNNDIVTMTVSSIIKETIIRVGNYDNDEIVETTLYWVAASGSKIIVNSKDIKLLEQMKKYEFVIGGREAGEPEGKPIYSNGVYYGYWGGKLNGGNILSDGSFEYFIEPPTNIGGMPNWADSEWVHEISCGDNKIYIAYTNSTGEPTTKQTTINAVAAIPTASTVLVNGDTIAFDAYNINGSNYFKLRDLAYILSGTEKQFDIGWDGINNAISLTSGKTYTIAGGEMASKGAGNKTSTPTNSKIYLDGVEVKFTAYNIEGNNFFKLRDVGQAFNFGVDWDGANNTIMIDTSKEYTE